MAWGAPSRAAEAYSPPRSRLITARSGGFRIHLAAVSAWRSGKRSTTQWLSRLTRRVPKRRPRRNGRVRRAMLPSLPPLRTVQVNFSTYSSSLSFRPCDRTRFLRVETLAMNLLMTGWVKQHTVLGSLRSSLGSPQNVMAVPSGNLGDLLVADRTQTSLFLPELD